jgi:alpha-glucosidase
VADHKPWWRGASIYQVYLRSFADGDGDGAGDLAGVLAHLDYLRDLGVDALWLTPWYPSPLADGGYDVADYRDIDPMYGTLAEAEELVARAHDRGLRVIIDIVPNHCSSEHAWFRAALAAAPGSPERARFWFRDGRGPGGAEPPNDWQSRFGGPAWTRVPDGQWYLHMFAPDQPDFNWDSAEVRAEFADILRFWLDRGIDGFRIDVAHGLVKESTLPDLVAGAEDPQWDRDGVHDIWREWRRIADSYPGERALVGEVWVDDVGRFARYLRPDELHSAFNFDFLCCAWEAGRMRACIDATLAAHAPVGAPATWVLANHDVTRHVTRYGRADTSFDFDNRQFAVPTDLELGTRRARAAALLTFALPGGVYIYQGDELGLWEVEDIPDERREDPVWERSGHTDRGRDGCRVPMPWGGEEPPFGFGPSGRAWLPQPAAWKDLTVAVESGDPHSMLELYRSALAVRRAESGLGDGPMRWLPAPDRVLAFARDGGFTCLLNLSGGPVPLPDHDGVLAASGPLEAGQLPPDTAIWLRTSS